jgi:hypothetical protein
MQTISLKNSGAQTGSTTGDTVNVASGYVDALFVLDVTAAATEVGDTLDVYVDASPDAGTTWLNVAHFTQKLGNGGATKEVAKISRGVALDNNDATLVVTADAAAAVVRQLFVGNTYRYRSVIVDAGTDNASFTYSLVGIFS